MSQKTQIVGVKHSGAAVFLGYDKSGNPQWSRNPEKIMDWLCNGWRFRFNQHRQYRTSKKAYAGENGQKVWIDTPLGGLNLPGKIKDSEARNTFSWLASMPSMVIQSSERIENTDWFAGLKRIKSTGKGKAPGFKKYQQGQSFVCWHNKGANANFQRVGKRSGMVTIKGQNKRENSNGGALRWELKIRVRYTQEIREYTSIRVNWSNKTLIFTNTPLPVNRQVSGNIVGLDIGVKHTLASSDGRLFDIPQPSKSDNDEYKNLQRKLARQDRVNESRGGKQAVYSSNRRKDTLSKLNSISARNARKRRDWVEKVTTSIVKDYDYIAIENISSKRLSQKGGSRKRGLNRSIAQSCWGALQERIKFKADISGVELIRVNPAYTSQRCSECFYTARENRKSQAIFLCKKCGHQENADINAAVNILDRALCELSGQDFALERGDEIRPLEASVSGGTVDETLTPALSSKQ